MKITYLVKVRYALSGLMVYKITTSDIYHSVGKIVLTSIEHINRIDYSEWTVQREQYWIDNHFTIYDWKSIEI